jgi:alpha-1,3-mannosyltransferase
MATLAFAVLRTCKRSIGIAAVESLSAGLFPALSDIPPLRRLIEQAGVGMLVDFSRPDAAAEEFLARWHRGGF